MALCLAVPSFIPVNVRQTQMRVFIPVNVRQTQMKVFSCRFRIYANLQSPELERRSGHYPPTIWNDNFIQSLDIGDENEGKNMERVSKLKKEVSQMIYKEELLRDKLELVDTLQQLGVAYHFKDEINSVITNIHESMDHISPSVMLDDLYEVSLLFRLFRMHGFSVNEDIFHSYFDDKGNCKANLSNVKEMISLYEASFHAKEGEEILEMARHFTTKHLTKFLECSKYDNSRLKEQVAHALELPLHWRLKKLHNRWFIEQYKIDEHSRPALRELSVLDFNLIQNLYKKELKQVSRWWTDLGLYEKLPFIRDRVVENYLWAEGYASDHPKNSSYRMVMAQSNCLIVTVDDIYDVYGSMDELEVFTNAIEQWDVTATEGLPEIFRMCILALFNTVEDHANKVLKEKGLYVIPYLRRAWIDLCKSYLVEARWYHNGYKPTLEEYLENAWFSISGHLVLSNAYCINDYVTAKDLEQFSSGYPDFFRYGLMNQRLYDDLGTSTDEIARGDNDKSIQCYMRDKSVTESVARQEIKELIWKNWKSLNGEAVGNSAFEKSINDVAFNIPRTAQRFYQIGDGFGKPGSHTMELVTKILLEPVN